MSADEQDLIEQAVAGDQVALQKLLVARAEALARHAHRKLPAALREVVDADDIVQQTYIEAFRSIGRFRPDAAGAFQSWLFRIAEHVISDTIKHYQRVKRGRDFRRRHRAAPTQSQSVVELLEQLSAGSHSPSRSVMGHEAIEALMDAIDDLPDDHRQAVQLRLLDGKSLQETAVLMNRSQRAVQGLVDRAKKKMRAALGSLSNYR